MKVELLREAFRREAFTISFDESAAFTEVYGFVGRSGRVFLEGHLLTPRGAGEGEERDTLILFMHPASSLGLLPLPTAMAAAGFHVMCGGSRYLRNDTALIMEKVALDMGAYVRHARDNLGYRKVVLAGWSGGGSLSLFYQAQAERPTVTMTPAGDPLDLRAAALPPADAVLSIAAHLSRAETLTEWIDPSVLDESNPDLRDPDLDIYAPDPRHRSPFSADFLAHFRAAQVARNERITVWAEEMLDRLKTRGGAELERGFMVHRTMCDPRWIDPAVDPNGRRADWCYLGDPRTANVGPVGLARYTTLRAWLSQWSYDRSNARTMMNAPRISVPALVIENGADDATPAAHPRLIFEALGSRDKTFRRIEHATHYYQQQPHLLVQAVEEVREWLRARDFRVPEAARGPALAD
ncbi:MAG: lysophospholipase [Sphingobium sp.]|jgi:pimeloyl-ACP methyl ester carboxylesterase|nr:lysophospholipase [Sphingobium sp.]MCI1270733.1 alpha/beta hydrolase [Sphingobium sp.]MCI1755137.1 alpha/beta hydrolase [Sphingobium sp.]MCI2053449.1 alpha/beta hydrolase [Sphingobium sp.]